MALHRTIDLLPEIFRTETNKKFLAATLDQLTQEPNVNRTQGYVGRRVGPGVNPADNYITEPTETRTDYQLEPGVVLLNPNTGRTVDAITYPGMIDALALQNGNTARQDRLFESEYYTWDPFCDLDKFSNYSQYYWLPAGPDSVDVGASQALLSDDFTVTRSDIAYSFSGVTGTNPIITLIRGGNYTFDVNQVGHNFWIQSTPGVNGNLPQTPNISSRDVYGVVNNGEDQGTVEFYAPLKTAQDFYYTLPEIAPVGLVTGLKFNQINNIYVAAFLEQYPTGIDGITNLDGKTLIFTNNIYNAEQGGWQITTLFDPEPNSNPLIPSSGTFDETTFDQTTDITLQSQRYSIWQVKYVYDDSNNPYMTLESIIEVPSLTKFRIQYGNTYSSTFWYKNASGYYEEVPLLTAIQDILYYQDGTNPEIFGEIRLIDQTDVVPIDVNEIIGAKTFTSPNGVTFTNGLKVQFRGPTTPAEYQDLEFYVEGVGTGPGLNKRVGFIDGEAYFGLFHVVDGQKLTGPANTTDFQQYIYDTYELSILNRGAGGPTGAPLPTSPVAGALRGTGIKLIPVSELITPETYTKSELVPYDSTSYDTGNFDASLNAPLVPDYLTQNRSSVSRNAWSRSNRWFHIDVINYSATANGITPVINNDQRAKRPIIEFRENVNLWNTGTLAKKPVNIIDFSQTDALSNVNGQIGYGIDGYTFLQGTRVIFAADIDPNVRNRIYEVRFIDPTNSGTLIIDLVPTLDNASLYNESIVSLNGSTQQGKSFWFNGITWQLAQEKTSVNQPPLFDIYDSNGFSFGDRAVYPSTTFAGSRLFGYADNVTSTRIDDVLGFPLKFLNINNVGDIVFTNFLYNDTFIFVQNKISTTQNVSTGFVRQYIDRVSFTNELGWQPAAEKNRSRQVFRFVYAGTALTLDVPIDTASLYPALQIYADSVFVEPGNYTYTINADNTTTITFTKTIPNDIVIEIQALSNVASAVAFYQVPLNLENNSLNGNSAEFTLGTVRTHYDSIGQNLKTIVGPINGANNSRDLGNIIPYGTTIVQNSAPLVLPGIYLREPQYELFSALTFNSQEYQKYKTLLLDLASRGDFVNLTPTQVLDVVVQEISLGKSELFPFYWSDMLPAGETYSEITYTYSLISTNVFEIGKIYNFDSSNFQGLLVYVNGNILTKGYDYTVSTDSSTITILTTLAVGDVITIREYSTTYGTYVPNTPTKMGLYPSYRPSMFIDNTYVEPIPVIQGHDGSITVAFGDFRDDVLLEFETRIFNNLKIQSTVPLTLDEVMPGQFRTTEYTLSEINEILVSDFLGWVGWNKLDYTTQEYRNANPFTYNYSQSSDRLNKQPLLGAWRGIYNYFYDTTSPNTTPWEMLGFSQEPTWWQDRYGPAPYTSGNLVLWGDLEAGYIADPMDPRIDAKYVRPGLLSVIPVGSEGELLAPLKSVVGNYDATSFRRSWAFGDDGPTENAWRTSSAWPFAVMRLLALTRPGEFFSVFADRDRYVYDTQLEQYLWDGRYRLEAKNMTPLYGNGVSKASYNNWIIDYNQQRGVNSSTTLTNTLANVDVRLCWRMAGYSDKRYLKIYSERSTPLGTNSSLLLPDESYQILLYQNTPFAQIAYSSVVVQVVDDGWAVFGYNTNASYFEILASNPTGKTVTVTAGGQSEVVNVEYSTRVVQVPYGFVFRNRAAVCDFLFSYGELLKQRGMTFEGIENGYIMDWPQMAQEFLYWSNQGWTTGSIMNLNPAATSISVTRPGAVVESLTPPRLDNLVLNQNRQVISPSNLVIDRLENTFKISSLNGNTINYLKVRFTAYEHMVVLDNRSIFADLIYDPITGARQSRILVSGWLTGDWNGTVNAPGFVLNQDNVPEWRSNQKYTKGEIVLFKNEYWSASTIIKPSAEFDYNLWIKSDYQQIQKGLLPNAANASDQLAQSYSVYNANLETEVDIFSYGLIGFRPRQYMQALNLDDVSQVNLYQQFLGTKGTRRATDLFSLANLGKEIAEYSIYEYWSILRSTYGANANRSFFEVLLNEAKLPSDPSLIQIVQPEQTSNADQTILVSDIWKSNYKITSPNILPTTTDTTTDVGLPTAGYVSLEDADITVFDLVDPANIQTVISSVGIGTTIWVAKVNSYDWSIYRAEQVPGAIVKVEDNLNQASLVTFNAAHGLNVGDTLIIKNFTTSINGVYIVRAVPGIYTVVINYIFTQLQTSVTGDGLGLTLQTTRVSQPSDIPLLPFADQLQPGVKVWVDNNGENLWTVLEKSDPFEADQTLVPKTSVQGSQFGASVSQGLWNLTALVGAPGYNPDAQAQIPGAVYTYVRTDRDVYEQNSILTLTSTDASGYGNQIEVGDQSWAVIGASTSNNDQGYATTIYVAEGSNVFEQRQLLTSPEIANPLGKFGHGVTISNDERWMYIGAPDINTVFAYTRVDVEIQKVEYVTDGIAVEFNYSNEIIVEFSYPSQLSVVLNNNLLTYGVDYSLTTSSVVFLVAPIANQNLIITRNNLVELDKKVHTNVEQSSIIGSGTDAKFTVVNTRGVYQITLTSPGTGYAVDDVITLNQYDIATDVVPPAPAAKTYLSNAGSSIILNNNTGIVPGMTISGTGFNSGQYVDSLIGGDTVVMSAAPNSTPSGTLTFSYSAKVIVTEVDGDGGIVDVDVPSDIHGVANTPDFDLKDYLVTVVDDNIYSFTVRVNDVIYRPELDYTFVGSTLTFTTLPPMGATILVNSNSYFTYVDSLTVAGLGVDSQFGFSVSCSTSGSQVMVGSPSRYQDDPGEVYVFDRNIQQFMVTDATQTTYYPVQDMIDPGYVSVTLNGEFLVNTDLNINGTFTVDTSNPSSQFVTITAPLAVGDTIQIETNQFNLIETLASANPSPQAHFGWNIDQCINDCSAYISSPYDSTILPEAGKVELYRNQARVYGTITTDIANPTLTSGEYIRINNMFVENTGTTVAELVADINLANIPNVIALASSDLVLEGDGTTQAYDIGDMYSAASSYTPVVYLGPNLESLSLLTQGVDYSYNNTTQQILFTVAPYNTSVIVVVSGILTITVKNIDATQLYNRLSVLPGTGTLFDDVGLDVYAWQQEIVSPVPQSYARFGESLFISDDSVTLLVGAPNGSMIRPTTFDAGNTYFDSSSTNFADPTDQSGVVYSYDALRSASSTVTNPSKFVFGQQFTNSNVSSLDQFGASVNYTTGVLLIGAPSSDFDDSSLANFGQVLQYHNPTLSPAWKPVHVQQPSVDTNLLDTIFMYDRASGQPKQYFDFIDPLQGRLLGVVKQNIDYIGAVDPAAYNMGLSNNYGQQWAQERVGQIWWDTNRARFIDPHQNDIVYASRQWGQLFPGSQVDMYQWIVSTVPPASYVGPGTPYSIDSYVITSSVNEQGFLETQYYFWVTGIVVVNTTAGKTLSIDTLSRYIESPKSSGISYIAPISASTIAIYNGLPYISAQDTVLYVGYDREATENAVHVEYQLVAQNRPDAFLNAGLYRKFLDSLSGYDTAGNAVPDPFLGPSQKYGVEFRPRQSMFVNRFLALKNYIEQSNTVLAQYPISETRSFSLLNSAEPEPSASSGQWDKRVANYEELSYQDLAQVPVGYRYLVVSDSTNNGLWTIYTTISGSILGSKTLSLLRVQNYDTRRYWNYINWYKPGYNPLTRILMEVPNVASLDTITVPNGSSVKVTANGTGKWEIYLLNAGTWDRVGLQSGTIEISNVLWNFSAGRFGFDSEVFDAQYYDQSPIIETRKILQALNDELFIGELLIERNNLLMLMFNYILSEQIAPSWLTKTSLIDVDHVIRNLVPYQVYRRDNQDFVFDYIQEVKPYHVQIREFNLKYKGFDQYNGSVNDFDLPAYWDTSIDQFVSPILDNTGKLSTTSSRASTDPIWSTFPWNQWYQNYLLQIESVTIIDGGSGYTTPPVVVVTGECTSPAVMTAQINSAGVVVAINIVDSGEGYLTTALITLSGGNGSGAMAVANMGNTKVRNMLTVMKYDRYEYAPTFAEWQANISYAPDELVRYANRVWSANSAVNTATFDPSQWTVVPASDLSGVDRTMGYYVPTPDQPGLELALLISGVEYPGVQVMAPDFNQDTGFDVGNYDINPFDNISYGPDGTPSYDPAILDAIYESDFADPYLGTLPAPAYNGAPPNLGPNPIVVDGGAFVDTYESHAPEELVPGITYDTLDIRVFTTPGADWIGDGHGFPEAYRSLLVDTTSPVLSFTNLVKFPIQVSVVNQSQGLELNLGYDFAVDWINETVTINGNVAVGDTVVVYAYGLGGGNQLYINSYVGTDVNSSVIIPMTYSLVQDFVIFSNGSQVTDYEFTEGTPGYTVLIINDTFTSINKVTITAMGTPTKTLGTGWSTPLTQYIESDGSLSYTLTNSVEGTNPANVIVSKNGSRARPSEGAGYIGNGVTVDFNLPSTGGYNLDLVSNNDVVVYVDNTPLVLGVGFVLNPTDFSTAERSVTLTTAPAVGSVVELSVRTRAQYWINGNIIVFQPAQGLIPVAGDIIAVTTFNDTTEQGLLTQVFVGPTTRGIVVTEPYDSTLYDEGTVNNNPGTFDWSDGQAIQTNTFELGRTVIDPGREIVTLDGHFLILNQGFSIDGSVLTIFGPTINASQVVAITIMTDRTVPSAMAFRIFQDMRGQQTTYSITPSSTTAVAQPVLSTDDIIYVDDASKLDLANLTQGIFGLVTINGERIAYRTRNTTTNTISGLRRGTAGTGAANHEVGASVYDIGLGNLLQIDYQNYVDQAFFLADGETTVFVASDITVTEDSTTTLEEAVIVAVGGIIQTSGYTVISGGPVSVEFDIAPLQGYQVSISVRRGVTWYNPGPSTPSDGIPLQDTNNVAARFLRGD